MISNKLKKIIADDNEFLFQNYGRLPVSFVKGNGDILTDQDGKKYIDFFSGIAVNTLGHANRNIKAALNSQVDRIIHSSNWYYNQEQIEAAKLISEFSFPGKTLFVNSGTEASEAAIKLVRKFGLSQSKKKYQIITFSNSFHGRTFGAMSATAQSKIHDGFGPIVPGFVYLPYNNIKLFEKEIRKNKNIAGVMIELIQGEGGIVLADKDFVKTVFELSSRNGIVTVVDEVQTGIGRTGKIFGYQHYDISPDIITLAKGLGAGVPIGAIHAKKYLADIFTKGVHGTTFGGNHLSCAAAAAVLKEFKKSALLANVEKTGKMFFDLLADIKSTTTVIKEIRGVGLHIGIELTIPGIDIVKKAMDMGLIINCTSEKVIRIMPPLNIKPASVKAGVKILKEIFKKEGN